MDNLTKEQRHKNMKNIKSKDTSIEMKLRKDLWNKGYRYRKNWEILKSRIERGNNSKYWLKKLKEI